VTEMEEVLERIRRAEDLLRAQAMWNEWDPVRLKHRIRASIGGTIVLSLLAFLALVPIGAALGMVVRILLRMLNG